MNQATFACAGKTDCGLKRTSNQDHYLVSDLSRSLRVESTSMPVDTPSRLCGGPLGHLFLVADGMGGHQAGNRASELAINFFVANLLNSLHWVIRPDIGSEQRFLSDLKDILVATHRAIVADSNSQANYKGMGTTLTAAYLVWPKIWIVHAGDTRCYLFRNGELRQITRDHTIANQLLEHGAIAVDTASTSHWANILWNALGAGAKDVVADIYRADLLPGDRVLLCSDGLNKHVDDKTIQSVLQETLDPDQACEQLIDLANAAGGSDNITAIVVNCITSPIPRLITTVIPTSNRETVLEDLSRFDSFIGGSVRGAFSESDDLIGTGNESTDDKDVDTKDF